MEAVRIQGQPRALVSRAAILHNVQLIRRALRPGVRLCAMVKADAYGHGAALVADALTNFTHGDMEAPAVDALAVATMEEAESLAGALWGFDGPAGGLRVADGRTRPPSPRRGIVPVHVMRPVERASLARQREMLEGAIRAGWVLTIVSAAAARDVANLAAELGLRANVQVMVDTGMSREGAPESSVEALLVGIEAEPSLRLDGLCTHLATAEETDRRATEQQLRRFRRATDAAKARSARLTRHAANTAAAFFHPDAQFDMVRPGIGLYGIDPTGRPSIERALRPAFRWVCPLLMVRSVRAGEAVGYGQTWRASRPTRLGLVPVGYADGYLRGFSNRAMMRIRGRFVPVVGRVSMDYATVDVTDLPEVRPGDEVTVLDCDPLSPASVYALAEAAGTIPYEVLVRVGARVQRVAIDPADQADDEATWEEPGWRALGKPA